MKEENLRRFIWTKDELKQLLIGDFSRRGIVVEGETALRLEDQRVIFEVWKSERGEGSNPSEIENSSPGPISKDRSLAP